VPILPKVTNIGALKYVITNICISHFLPVVFGRTSFCIHFETKLLSIVL
jgi:hypothetical protein